MARMITVVLRELPSGSWHATAADSDKIGMSFVDDEDPLYALQKCVEMLGVRAGKLGPVSNYALWRLHNALDRNTELRGMLNDL